MPKNDSISSNDRLPGMPPPLPRRRLPAATPAPEYDDSATEIDEPQFIQKKWLDSIETIPFDPSMRVSERSLVLSEGTPPRAVPPVRVDARPAARAGGTPRPAPRNHTPRPIPPRPPARHPYDNQVTRSMHVDIAGGHVSFSPDPDVAPEHDTVPPLPSIPTPAPGAVPLYGAPALPPHAPTAMAMPLPAQLPTQVASALPALVRPYQDGVTPYPVPPWATGAHAAAQPAVQQSAFQHRPAPQNLDIYADTGERANETLRVAALPPSMPAPTVSLRPSISKYLVPMIGGTALLAFVAGYFLVRGDSSRPAAAPIASAAVMPVQTAPAAPIVSEIVEPQLPDPSWKHRETKPTIVPIAASAEEPVAAAAEIELAPAPAKKKSSSSSSSRRAKRARVAVIELPKAAKAAKAERPSRSAKADKKIARSTKSERDPILEEIERGTKSAPKATGPGKLKISSTVPTLIYIDGRSTNLMTPKTLNLSPGSHKITLLELKSRKAKTFDIDIASGSVVTMNKKF